METEGDHFEMFSGFDRLGFPESIKRVTAGSGGEALLIIGSEKTALFDCGMAYCAEELIKNIKAALGGGNLDYILISHTHYDHVGALPFIRRAWPGAVTFGAEHARDVFNKGGAVDAINSLGMNANKLFGGSSEFKIIEGGFVIDEIVRDGDRISLGKEEVVVLETKGHTDCSLTYVLEPDSYMFMSESTGHIDGPDRLHVTILKSYKDAMASVEKCRNYGAKHIISAHYGLMPDYYIERYWELFLLTVEEYKQFLYGLFAQGLSMTEIMEKYEDNFWNDSRKKVQPKEAFMLNASNVVKVFLKEYESEKGVAAQCPLNREY